MSETTVCRAMKWAAWTAAFAGTILAWNLGAANAQDVKSYTRQTFDQWFAKYKDAKPDFKPGDVLTSKDLERMRPFVPPGYLEQMNFPEFKAQIMKYADHTPRKDFMDCTEKYGSQTKLTTDGAMTGYVCGQPFPLGEITSAKSPTEAGSKIAWNFESRWQNFGFFCVPPATWDRFGGHHEIPSAYEAPPPEWTEGVIGFNWQSPSGQELKEIYGGGGTFQRTLSAVYHRLYYSHLAMFQDHLLPVENAKTFSWKEFTGFFDPFDIRGTAFIVYRYDDAHRADDAWAYIPNLRRVRRISAEVKSDSLLGTDHTIEDFYGFSGRPLEWKWKLLGFKDALCVMDSKYNYSHLYGPNGIVPDDAWSIRHFAVIERISKSSRHPYSAAIDFWDTQNWDCFWMQAWDRKGKLWKTWEFQKEWTEDFKNSLASINHGVHSTNFQSIQVLDTQNNRGTIWITPGGYPNIDASKAQALYDINKLEQIHR